MLKKITFKKDYRCFKAGDSFNFEQMTVLVGDQGCGKSSIINLLAGGKSSSLTKEIISIDADETHTRHFDYEKHNPRIGKPVDTARDLAILWSSHGQFVNRLNDSICDEKNVLWLVDEPDAALSIRSCIKLAKHFKTALKNGCQIVASIHSPVVMSEFEKVYSLEHKKWMTPNDFIETQLL